MKRILFPFYNSTRHNFLFKRWWFRAGIVLYIIAIVIIPLLFFSGYMEGFTDCYYWVSQVYDVISQKYDNAFKGCQVLVYGAIPPAIGYSLFLTVVIHYLIQLIFFKIIVDFVYLGSKK